MRYGTTVKKSHRRLREFGKRALLFGELKPLRGCHRGRFDAILTGIGEIHECTNSFKVTKFICTNIYVKWTIMYDSVKPFSNQRGNKMITNRQLLEPNNLPHTSI